MPYIERDKEGRVVAVSECNQFDDREYVNGTVELWRPFILDSALDRCRAVRQPILFSLVGMLVTEPFTEAEIAAVKTAIRQLKDITVQAYLLESVSDEQFKGRALELYEQYAAPLPLSVKVAFREATT